MSINKELHEALENLDGTTFTKGKTIAQTLRNLNNAHVICETTITATTVGSTIVVKDMAGQTISAKPNGKYDLHEESYSIINSKSGCFDLTTIITISQADITAGTKSITLDALVSYCVVTFAAVDSSTSEPITDFELVVKSTSEGTPIVNPNEDGTYNLAAASYTYDISKTGYVAQTGVPLVISSSDVTTGTKTVTASLVASV